MHRDGIAATQSSPSYHTRSMILLRIIRKTNNKGCRYVLQSIYVQHCWHKPINHIAEAMANMQHVEFSRVESKILIS